MLLLRRNYWFTFELSQVAFLDQTHLDMWHTSPYLVTYHQPLLDLDQQRQYSFDFEHFKYSLVVSSEFRRENTKTTLLQDVL